MAEHTPTPWKTSEQDGALWIETDQLAGNEWSQIVCKVAWEPLTLDKLIDPENSRANAAHIVLCVNSHAALIEACKAALIANNCTPDIDKLLDAALRAAGEDV